MIHAISHAHMRNAGLLRSAPLDVALAGHIPLLTITRVVANSTMHYVLPNFLLH